LQLFSTYRLTEPVTFGILYTLFFSISTPMGGILFGIAFWSTGNRLGSQGLRDFMIISAYGIVLFFVSNQAIVLATAPYPPFGLSTVSFIGLGTYLLLVGIYYSALSLAQDVDLRKAIRKSVEDKSILLDKIGTAEMEKQILTLTNTLSNKLEGESGVQASLEEVDIKDYLNEVIEEVKKKNINS
jgi:hypothetical protein